MLSRLLRYCCSLPYGCMPCARAPHPHALQVLERLRVKTFEAPRVLPRPHMFTSLQALAVDRLEWDPAWFKQLGQLRHLEWLELCYNAPSSGRPAQPWVVSGVPAVAVLFVQVVHYPALEHDTPPLCIDLATLPSLEELNLDTYGPVELHTAQPGAAGSPGPGHSLRRLQVVRAQSAAVDFAALPGLSSLYIYKVHELVGAATTAGAASLRRLTLGGTPAIIPDFDLQAYTEGPLQLWDPWVPELLRHAPPSLRCLRLYGALRPAVAEAVVELAQLRVLSRSYPEDEPSAWQLGGGPVWEHLRALRWECEEPLPACWLCRAT